MQETALPRYNGLTLQHHHSPVVSVGIDVVSPITDALRTGYTCFELKFLFITLYFCTGMCWRVVVCTQVKGNLCGFIWLPIWPRLLITWGSTPLQNLSITGTYNAIPETLQGTLEYQTSCNTCKYTYLHDIKYEERTNLPISRNGHEHGLK